MSKHCLQPLESLASAEARPLTASVRSPVIGSTGQPMSGAEKAEFVRKKAPTEFIFPEDWAAYLQTCCQLHQVQKLLDCSELEALRILHGKRHGHRACLLRLVAAFNQLYAEYNRLIDLTHSQAMTTTTTSSADCNTPFNQSNWKQPNRQVGETFPASNEHDFESLIPMRAVGKQCRSSVDFGSGDAHGCILSPQQQPKVDFRQPRKHRKTNSHDNPVNMLTEDEPQCTAGTTPISSGNYATQTAIGSNSVSLYLTPEQTSSASQDGCSYSSSKSSTRPLIGLGDPLCFAWCKAMDRKGSTKPAQYYKDILMMIKRDKSLLIDQSYFDKISRKPCENTLLVYQTMHHQIRREHRVRIPSQLLISPSMLNCSGDFLTLKFASETVVTIRLPIALELILPRMQKQIDEVMRKCPNVYDPLEVAAELRQVNYDSEACVAYFQRTQPLRDIIEEFLPFRKSVANLPSSDLAKSKASKHQNSSRTSNATCTLSLSKTSMFTFLFQLQTTLEKLKKEQAGAARRLESLREYVLEVTEKLSRALAERIVEAICSSTGIQQLISGQHSDLPFSQLARLAHENQTLKQALCHEESRRKSVFNMMQEYLGNIRVYCRCRTVPQCGPTCLQVRSIDTVVVHSGADGNSEQFKFDRVFPSQASQAEVFTELLPIVASFLDGYNVCFLTYGGEASGKTYTLLGSEDGHPEKQGIAHRALRTILAERDARQHDWQYQLTVAVVEIYNDTLIDLLANESSVHVRADLGLDQMLENLKMMPIDSENDIDSLLNLCRARRRKGRTALNAQSSRSHLLLFYRLKTRSHIDASELCSVLALCDLAGFEDIIKADTQADPVLAKEAGYINRSLTALNRVFTALRGHDPNCVSYRDSKLTYLLKPFFTFSGKCLLIVTVRTDRNNLASTQSTLRFGRESRGVVLGRARRQFNLDRLIEDMRVV